MSKRIKRRKMLEQAGEREGLRERERMFILVMFLAWFLDEFMVTCVILLSHVHQFFSDLSFIMVVFFTTFEVLLYLEVRKTRKRIAEKWKERSEEGDHS